VGKIAETMTAHHRHCDDAFAAAENAVSAGNWAEATRAFSVFHQLMEGHFTGEETCLFPAFEAETGHTQGPTQVMRMEHIQMRQLLVQLQASLTESQQAQYLGASETLLIMMQQHNIKEEKILYPMCDHALASSEPLLAEMAPHIPHTPF
jgi:DUF438 domain-containing protein